MPNRAILAATLLAALLAAGHDAPGQTGPSTRPHPTAPASPAKDEPTAPSSTATETDPGSATALPLRVRFRLRDDVVVRGALERWDEESIDGSFGRREWTELKHQDIWRLYRRLMNPDDVQHWIDLGRSLLLAAAEQPKAAAWAERAFARAIKIDAAAAGAVEAARADAEAVERARAEAQAAAAAERLRTLSPEARGWGSTPWTPLTDEEQRAAAHAMRSDAANILQRAGLQLVPVETDYFLFYSDMPRRQATRWAGELDVMYRGLAERFDLEEGENLFWGKAVIFVFNKRDRFQLVEAEAFGHLAGEWVDGMCHPSGPKVFVSFYRQPVDEVFAAILVHETVHGFMHRYRTPRRLPTWANEGFADYLASVLFRNSPIDLERRRKGLRYIRRGGDVDAILDMSYGDGSWPGPDRIGYYVGYLLVELMIRDRPHEFGRWVDAIKDGADWETALTDVFGVPRDVLVERFVRFYRVND